MPKWLKILLGSLFLLVLVLGGVYLIFFNDPVPKGQAPEKADELAKTMLDALNYDAYKETRYLDWTYRGGRNTYHWDKAMGKVRMTWGEYSGEIDLVTPEKSTIKKDGRTIGGDEKKQLTTEAISNFNNDSFWLVAPFKIFDQGTERSLVQLEDGKEGLLVTYTVGGDTPGDTYLWEFDDHYIPVKFRMWVKILPLKGLAASWEGWQKTQTGVWLPQYHRVGPITLDLGTVRTSR